MCPLEAFSLMRIALPFLSLTFFTLSNRLSLPAAVSRALKSTSPDSWKTSPTARRILCRSPFPSQYSGLFHVFAYEALRYFQVEKAVRVFQDIIDLLASSLGFILRRRLERHEHHRNKNNENSRPAWVCHEFVSSGFKSGRRCPRHVQLTYGAGIVSMDGFACQKSWTSRYCFL